jgi:hypothetical protein
MKRFDLLRAITFLILAYGIFSGNSCFKANDTDVDSPCGPLTTWDKHFKADEYYSADLDGTTRHFVYEDVSGSPEDICPEKHISVFYTFQLKHEIQSKPDSFKAIGNAYWSLYGRESTLEWNGDNNPNTVSSFHTNDEIGLKQAFGDKKGYIGMQLHLFFPTRGALSEDVQYIDSLAGVIQTACNYYKYKF